MKKNTIILAVAVVLIIGIAATALAGRGSGPRAIHQDRLYKTTSVETVRGEVIRVETSPISRGRGYGIHLQLNTDSETVDIHLGPTWFVEKQSTQIKAGDQIEVRGSRITFENKPTIIAAEVKKGSDTLQLRDDKGIPLWAGQGQRQRAN